MRAFHPPATETTGGVTTHNRSYACVREDKRRNAGGVPGVV